MSTTSGVYFDGQVARGRSVSIEFTTHGVLRLSGEGLAQEIPIAQIQGQ